MAVYQSYNKLSGPIRGEAKRRSIDLDCIEFESEEERIRYLINEFPGLVKEGRIIQAMGIVQGNSRLNWFFVILNKTSIWLARKLETLSKGTKKIEHKSESLLHETA